MEKEIPYERLVCVFVFVCAVTETTPPTKLDFSHVTPLDCVFAGKTNAVMWSEK